MSNGHGEAEVGEPVATRLPALLIFALAIPVFSRIINSNGGPLRSSDHLQHIDLARSMVQGKEFPPHPLFHVLLIALSGGDTEFAAPGIVAFVLAAALGVRAWLTAGFLSRHTHLSIASVTILCLALALAMPLPNWWQGDIYQGNVSPNAWHNPTAVFAMPFALGLFIVGTRMLAAPSYANAAAVGGAMLLSLLAKPNYVMAFGPCFVMWLLQSLGRACWSGKLRPAAAIGMSLLALGPAAILLVAQYALLPRDSRIIYFPFAVWGVYCHHHFWGAALIGLVFPLTVVVCYPREANASQPLVLAWATLAAAVATFGLFAQSGERMMHANFAWGMTLSDHVLFVASVAFLLQQRGYWRRAFCLTALALHAGSGAVALFRYYL